ncbi:MAG TPA: hypothetical protein VJZ71_14365 [Phycisphaerae bacterium]|nr:hypothetical protein [Phycisphaerae bacterium]
MATAALSSPTFRRVALYGLILLALTFVSAVVFVLATDRPSIADDEAFPEPVILDLERRPNFVFPVSARTYDLSLNRFVDRFARVCMQGQYSDFRLMLSRSRPPILPPRFESNFNALKNVRILQIERLPDVPQVEGPVYLMSAQYELEEFAVKGGKSVRQVQVAITREDGDWRIGPIPHDALEQLRAYQASQAAKVAPTSRPEGTRSPDAPSAGANRPARLDP